MTYAEQLSAAIAAKQVDVGARRRSGSTAALRRIDRAEARRMLHSFIRFGPPIQEHECGFIPSEAASNPLDEEFYGERVQSRRRWLCMERIAQQDQTLSGGIPTEWPEEGRFIGEETTLYDNEAVSLED